MNRPIRLIAAIALGAVVLLAALPAWLGWRAERTYRALLDELAAAVDAPPPAHRYRRGWLHSDVVSELRGANSVAFTVTLRLDHGPLAHEGPAPVMARVHGEVQPAPAAIPPLALDGTTDLAGVTRLTLSWPGAQLALPDGELAWETLRARLRYERRTRRLQAQVEAPRLQRRGARGWQAERAWAQLDLHAGPGGAPLGSAEAGAARLALGDDEVIDDGRVMLVARPEGDSVTLTADARLRAWRRHGVAAGPGTASLAARRLEPAAWWPLLRLAPTLARGVDGATALKLAPLAMQIARRAPVVELSALRLDGNPAALDGHGRLAFNARQLGESVSPGRLLARLAGELELNLPSVLAHGWLWPRAAEAGTHTAPPPYDRLFAPQPDDGYRLHAALKQGRLLVNGVPWHGPLPSAP